MAVDTLWERIEARGRAIDRRARGLMIAFWVASVGAVVITSVAMLEHAPPWT